MNEIQPISQSQENAYKLQQIRDSKYSIFIDGSEKEEYNLFNKDRFACFLEKEMQILNDEFDKL